MAFLCSGFLTVVSGIVSIFFGLLLLFQALRLPVVSVISVITEPRAVRLSLTMLLLSVITLLLLLCKQTAARWVIFIFAAAGLVCALITVVCNLSVASRQGIRISLAKVLSGEKKPAPADAEIEAYTQFEDKNIGLSLWKPVGKDSGAPVIVYIHGGGWMNGNRFENGDMHHCRFFAENGYLAASVDYPLATKERPLYDRQEDTLVQSVLWLREHAAEYGGDTSRLYLAGGSAGGNLALNLTARINKGEFAELLGADFRVSAASVLFPATDIAALYNAAAAPFTPLLRGMCTTNWGGTPEEYPERFAKTDSNRLADANMAPVYAIYGKNDHAIPYASVETYLARLDGLGVENARAAFPFADHLCDTCGSIEAQTWRRATVKWFNEH